MSIEVIEPQDFDEALAKLMSISQEFPRTEYVFRGQQSNEWQLRTSYDRYWAGRSFYNEFFVGRMIRQFQSGIARLGLEGPAGSDLLAWLEYARHHGLPAPLLDFSWSPFVALYFAFDGVRASDEPQQASAVYCLNLNQVAKEIARRKSGGGENPVLFVSAVEDFLQGGAKQLKSGFPADELLFVRYPSAHTRRMHAQLGTFIYSTILSGDPAAESPSLESFLEDIEEGFDSPIVPNTKRAVLTKIKLPHSWISEVFNHLDSMNITGSTMFLSPEGVARDVYNSYNYHPRSGFLREVFGS